MFFCNEAPKEQVKISSKISGNRIEVIDFHSTHRCMTCNAIESNTKFTLEKFFPNELEKGKISFQVINVDDERNAKLAEKFSASGTSLFLNVIANGKEKQIDLTNFAFQKGGDQESFSQELKLKLETEISNL
ncbi:MAG: hypothetical protein DWQ06_02910 [Calditrichaeota bacterium]|nr:MAG: hypothetical protein DWQ06_02910 [Calditrichota bacterium]